MGFKPWFRWGFVVVSGIALGGCQTPPPRPLSPPPPAFGKQTQQPPPPNFPSNMGTPSTGLQGQPLSSSNPNPWGNSLGQNAPVGGRAPTSLPTQQVGFQQPGATGAGTSFPPPGTNVGVLPSNSGLGNQGLTTARSTDLGMSGGSLTSPAPAIAGSTNGVRSVNSFPAPGSAPPTGFGGTNQLQPMAPPLNPPVMPGSLPGAGTQ